VNLGETLTIKIAAQTASGFYAVPDLKARRELVDQTWDGARMGRHASLHLK
jgi:hypothetical protein